MTPTPTLALTGVSGALGGAVARLLVADGIRFRAVARTPSRVPQLDGVEVVAAGFDDASAVTAALTGVETVLMISATESPDRIAQHRTFIDAAVAAGVSHIVYTSFIGAARDATFTFARDHWATEEYLFAAGPAITILRDSFYLDVLEHFADDAGVIRGPAGKGRCAFVARADVAAVAAEVLRDPEAHADSTYELTGPEALSFHDVAETLTRVRGREFRFENESVPEAYESRKAWDAPQWQYDAWVSTYTAIAADEMSEVSGDVEAVTGRAPLSFEDILRG